MRTLSLLLLAACASAPATSPTVPTGETPETPGVPGETSSSGGQSGSDPATLPCTDAAPAEPDAPLSTADGDFSADDLDFAAGDLAAHLVWTDGAATGIAFTLAWDGAVTHYTAAEASTGSYCAPMLTREGSWHIATDDGLVDESGVATLQASRPSEASFTAPLAAGVFSGGKVRVWLDALGPRGAVVDADDTTAGSFRPD